MHMFSTLAYTDVMLCSDCCSDVSKLLFRFLFRWFWNSVQMCVYLCSDCSVFLFRFSNMKIRTTTQNNLNINKSHLNWFAKSSEQKQVKSEQVTQVFSNPDKNKFHPNKIKFHPNKNKFHPNKKKFHLNKIKFSKTILRPNLNCILN